MFRHRGVELAQADDIVQDTAMATLQHIAKRGGVREFHIDQRRLTAYAEATLKRETASNLRKTLATGLPLDAAACQHNEPSLEDVVLSTEVLGWISSLPARDQTRVRSWLEEGTVPPGTSEPEAGRLEQLRASLEHWASGTDPRSE